MLILQSPGDADEFFRACSREIKKIPEDLTRRRAVRDTDGAAFAQRAAPLRRQVCVVLGHAVEERRSG